MQDKLLNSLVTVIVFLIPVALFVLLTKFDDHRHYVKLVAETPEVATTTEETAHLSFVGDVMLDRGVKLNVQKLGGGDYHYIFQNASFLKDADLMFANLEGPVSDRGSNVGGVYSFRFDPAVLPVLKDAGFDVLSMANNHIGDWGRAALEDTLTNGKENGFDMVGGGMSYDEARQPKIYTVNGIKIGYLGFSDVGPAGSITTASSTKSGILSAADPYLPLIISDAAAQVDILVVSFHFGVEYQAKANDRQKQLAHLAIDSGAKIVAGSHPHVAEETEEYKGGIIAYSLGNFVFDQSFSTSTMQGLKLDAIVSKEGLVTYSTSTIQINSNFQPDLAADLISN